MKTLRSRPRVFISSTIYDFADLRSALHYWLDHHGFETFLSDRNDCRKELDANSYEACQAAICESDYFVLLIGARIGGWYDSENQISITRQEYRWAMDSYQHCGRPHIVTFVRKSIWDVREDRKGLREVLDDDLAAELEDPDSKLQNIKSRIINHSSKLVTNPSHIFAFLNEVGQVGAMKRAQQGQGEFPRANWIHVFMNFQDITCALEQGLHIRTDTRTQVLILNMQSELIDNLRGLLVNVNGALRFRFWNGFGVLCRHSCKSGDVVSLSHDDVVRVGLDYLKTLGVGACLSRRFLDEGLRAGALRQFSPEVRDYPETLLIQYLNKLDQLLTDYQQWSQTNVPNNPEEFYRKYLDGPRRDCIEMGYSDWLLPYRVFRDLNAIAHYIREIWQQLADESFLPSPRENLVPDNSPSRESIVEWLHTPRDAGGDFSMPPQ